jgi:ribosomal protein S18 acetylase RimI-like enzyme
MEMQDNKQSGPLRTTLLNVFLEPDLMRKRALHERLTAMLPEWFGRPESNAKYARQAELLDGYIAESEGVRRGLVLVKWTSPASAEIYWIGVDPAFRGSGIGRALIEAVSEAARKRGVRYLFVMTLHPDNPDEPYWQTRQFYEALGFIYVLEEQDPSDPDCPMAWYLKHL